MNGDSHENSTRRALSRGKEFFFKPPQEVEDFLNSRKLETFECRPDSCTITHDNSRLWLHHVNGKAREWPIRKTFFEKLLRWHRIPNAPLYAMDMAEMVPFLNGLLKLIWGTVLIRIEDGEALTITSHRYAPVDDLDLLNRFRRLPVNGITRTDFATRIYFEERFRFEPIPSDPCGLGYHVFNSETGFMALQVCSYILRYVCSNGAISSFSLGEKAGSLVHYDVTPDRIDAYLEKALKDIDEHLPLLKDLVTKATTLQPPPLEKIKRGLDTILGYKGGERLLRDFSATPNASMYDLFNHITAKARALRDFNQKVRLETFAGNLLDPTNGILENAVPTGDFIVTP